MKKFLLIFLLMATPVWAQTVSLQHSTLFTSSSACSTGGPNSTFGGAWAQGARSRSSTFDMTVTDRSGNIFPIDHARLELTTTKADDDSLLVLLQGWSGDSSSTYLDTIYISATAGQTTYANLSPSMTSSLLQFPSAGRLSVANEDSGANGAFPYFGLVADTNIWTMKLVIWSGEYNTTTSTITISDYMLDADTLSLSNRILARADSATALYWPDTTVILTNVKALIGARADSSTALYWPDTTVILTNVKALINARADSSTALYWPDTTVVLTYSKALINARADSATALYWPDTTVVLTYSKALIGARADSSTALYWPDTTVVLTYAKSLAGNAVTIRSIVVDTAGMANDYIMKLNATKDTLKLEADMGADSSTVLYWPDTTVVLTNVKALINARADSSTALYWPDTTVILTNVKALIGGKSDSGAVAFLNQAESITGNWVNTTNPWADNEIASAATWNNRKDSTVIVEWSDTIAVVVTVSDTTVMSARISAKPDSGSVAFLNQAETIAGNWVNTANPWAVNEGGTGAVTLTDGGILLGTGTSAIHALGVAANGQIPIGDGTTDPVLATITGSAQDVVVTNGAGTITLTTRKPIQFCVSNPKNFTPDTAMVYLTPAALTIDSIYAIGHNDSVAFSLIEIARTGGTVSLIDAVDANTAGTNNYYKTETTISDAAVGAASWIAFVHSADTTESVTVVIFNH